MLRRLLITSSLAALVACGLLAPPGGYEGGNDASTAVDASPFDASTAADVFVAPDGQITVPGSTGTLVVCAGSRDPTSPDDDPAWSADVWSGVLDATGHVAFWRIEKSAPIVGPFESVAVLGGVLATLDVGLGVNGGRAVSLQSIGWAPGLAGEWRASRVDPPGGLEDATRLFVGARAVTVGGTRTFTDDAGTSTFPTKETHIAAVDVGLGKVGAFSDGAALITARSRAGAAVVAGNLYVAGGRTGNGGITAAVEASTVSAAAGTFDGFYDQPALAKDGQPHKVFQPAVFGDRGFVFVAGGRTSLGNTPTDVVQSAKMRADGSIEAWVPVTSLPTPLRDFGVVVHRDIVYVLGGIGPNGRTDDVRSAVINADGTLGAWDVNHSKLPAKRADLVGTAY